MTLEDAPTVHYVTQDPIQNLRIHVTLTRLSALRSKVALRNQNQAGQPGELDDAQPRPDARRKTAAATEGGQSATAAAAAADSDDGRGGLLPSHGQQSDAAVAEEHHTTGGLSEPPLNARPQPVHIDKVFAWQEKVHSKAEVVAAQAEQKGATGIAAGLVSRLRSVNLGSMARIKRDQDTLLDIPTSALFSYVHTDPYCELAEMRKRVTTSTSERRNHLVQRLLGDPHIRQKVLNFRAMYVMADLGDEHTVAGSNEKVLVCIKAYADGSFDMQPPFCEQGRKYRFEDDNGGIYEYSVVNASRTEAPSLEKRAIKLTKAVSQRTEEMRRTAYRMDAMAPPGPTPDSLRVMFMAEISSASGFRCDRLYVEWVLKYDPTVWTLQSSDQRATGGGCGIGSSSGGIGSSGGGSSSAGLLGPPQQQVQPSHQQDDGPGTLRGVTQVSKMVQYPGDPAQGELGPWVAHFSHPIELEWTCREAPAGASGWPTLYMQVCSHDSWDRQTTQGYGYLQLSDVCPGCSTRYIHTWRPLGTVRQRQQEWFVGGSTALKDITYLTRPQDWKGQVLNKYGFRTETSGVIKVRVNSLIQRGGTRTGPGNALRLGGGPQQQPAPRQRRELSTAVVLERARVRLKQARGGEVVVRDGVVAEPPYIRTHASDLDLQEGQNASFTISAGGLPPLRYQWYKDDRKLLVATSDTPVLVIADVEPGDQGAYHCHVSNKDGAVVSHKALLTVQRVSRMQRASTLAAAQETAMVRLNSSPRLSPIRTMGRYASTSDAGGSGSPAAGNSAGGSPSGATGQPRNATPRASRLSTLTARDRSASPSGRYRTLQAAATPSTSEGGAETGGVPPSPTRRNSIRSPATVRGAAVNRQQQDDSSPQGLEAAPVGLQSPTSAWEAPVSPAPEPQPRQQQQQQQRQRHSGDLHVARGASSEASASTSCAASIPESRSLSQIVQQQQQQQQQQQGQEAGRGSSSGTPSRRRISGSIAVNAAKANIDSAAPPSAGSAPDRQRMANPPI